MIDDESGLNKPAMGVAAAVVLAAFGGWYYWHSHRVPAPVAVAAPIPQAAPTAPPEERIAHPVPSNATDATQTPLPALNDSDAPFKSALAGASGTASFTQFLVPDSLIRHIVVTVDNLPRQKVAVDKRPIVPVSGSFTADGDELHATLDDRNYLRYGPMVAALRQVDLQKMVATYLHYYPLFQKAYQDLGYPNGYFNDRLVQVIDQLLATPQVAHPVELVRPNVMYVYADPALEARPAGQKLLIRMGPDNETAVKAKLMELRALLVAVPAR